MMANFADFFSGGSREPNRQTWRQRRKARINAYANHLGDIARTMREGNTQDVVQPEPSIQNEKGSESNVSKENVK